MGLEHTGWPVVSVSVSSNRGPTDAYEWHTQRAFFCIPRVGDIITAPEVFDEDGDSISAVVTSVILIDRSEPQATDHVAEITCDREWDDG